MPKKGEKMPSSYGERISKILKLSWQVGERKGGWKLNEEQLKRHSLVSKGRYWSSKPKKCKQCGTTFQCPLSIFDRKKFCSRKCYATWMKERPTENHPLFRGIGDKNAKLYREKGKINNPNYYKVRKDNSVIFRVRRRGLGGRITKKEWLDMKESCNFTCKKCKKKEPEIKLVADHIVPVVRWEEWIKKNTVNYMCGDKENIQPLCISCNCKKSSKLEDEVLEQLGYKHE